eukprot:Gregarina_sp_Poly_1__3006@NODE_1844_length_3226_cov_67_757202_g1197_i0_p2_GENE_NODE_1844_length_3226_cov_67_757202_g1197_i0NODE_1844_length_3226_cov_67_757202_g1197_i0_p2_ORF_typecomplete_len342_score34_01_NODE_1844_length_3226_cov_67_757202_g1197_i021173142
MQTPWASCFYYKFPLPQEAMHLRQAPNYSFIFMPKEVQERLQDLDAPDSPFTPPLGCAPELGPSGIGLDDAQNISAGPDGMQDSRLCGPGYYWPMMYPHAFQVMDDNFVPIEADLYDAEDTSQRQGGPNSKGMTQICLPKPENTAHRLRVQEWVEHEMDECLFTLKCKIYKDEVQLLLKEFRHDESQRSCISYLSSCPTISLNLAERQTLMRLGDMRTLMNRKNAQSSLPSARVLDESAKTLDETLTELLNSLANRLLFYILIEYRSWFPQDRARNQIVGVILDALFGNELAQLRDDSAELIKYIEGFIIQRSKNFRDVISRVCKRVKYNDEKHKRQLEVD